MKEFAEKILELAAENVKLRCLNEEYTKTSSCSECESHIIDKDSITSVINQIEF